MRRRGFTLMELMLVVAIIVAVGALVTPFMDAFFEPHTVQAALDQIRAEWTETRTPAMSEGIPYRFSVKPNTGEFRIEPDDPSDRPADEKGCEPRKLPSGIVFGSGDPSATTGPAGEFTPVAVFLADGTARD